MINQTMELVDGLNDCSNEIYHADRKYLSSSVLKVIFKSLDDYYDQYILGNKKEFGNQNALDEGSLVHAILLEPETVHKEFAFYKGFRKQGADWEKFKSTIQSTQRIIISEQQKRRVNSYIDAFNRRPEAVEMLKNGKAEQTICGSLYNVPIKVRFDYINIEKGIIYDIKTTSGPADIFSFKDTIKKYSYQLSAALYCAMAEKFYGKKFEFYFIVISKQDPCVCEVYKASEKTMFEGNNMVQIACAKYSNAKEKNVWTEENSLTNNASSDSLNVSAYEILEI